MEGGAKRHVTSPTVLSDCGYGWDAVRLIPNVSLNAIATGAPLSGPPCPHVLPPDGTLIRGSGPEVYVMEGGLKRHVPDLATFAGMGFLWGNVNLLPDSVLSAIPSGDSLLAVLAEGSLLAGGGPSLRLGSHSSRHRHQLTFLRGGVRYGAGHHEATHWAAPVPPGGGLEASWQARPTACSDCRASI